MRFNYIWTILGFCLIALSCKQEDIMLFDREEAGIYFQHGWQTRLLINSETYIDSAAFSFSVASFTTTDTILNARIRTMGNVKDYPRPVKLSVDQERTTAVLGTHYDIDVSAAVVPAGANHVLFPVHFYRTPDMLEEAFALVLKIEDNEHFKVYFTDQKNTNVHTAVGERIEADRFQFVVSEIYTMPGYWGLFGNTFFGTWTVAKYRFLNQTVNWTPVGWQTAGSTTSEVQLGRFGTAALMVRNALQELADAGTPMREADGSFMQMGANFQVDYSDYL